MPIFEFTCKSCNKNFEELVLKADEEVSCPSCSSKQIEKLMSSCRHSSQNASSSVSDFSSSQKFSSGSGCSGCSGGNCSSCG